MDQNWDSHSRECMANEMTKACGIWPGLGSRLVKDSPLYDDLRFSICALCILRFSLRDSFLVMPSLPPVERPVLGAALATGALWTCCCGGGGSVTGGRVGGYTGGLETAIIRFGMCIGMGGMSEAIQSLCLSLSRWYHRGGYR